MTLTEFITSLVVSSGLLIALPLFFVVRYKIYECFGWLELMAMFVWVIVMLYCTLLTFHMDDPGLYTRTLGAPLQAKVEGLMYMTGVMGQGRVRVDTDKGVYLLSSDALVPRSGEVYLVKRRRPWGDPRMFLCLTAEADQCWAEWKPGS